VNLLNFVDGIHGIAASEAIFIALVGALLTTAPGSDPGVGFAALVFVAACGFLIWDWPSARFCLPAATIGSRSGSC
jgi:Fuc2NAc and GlcNAc transferase